MSELVEDCPRCGAKKITFELLNATDVALGGNSWQHGYEAFCVCRHCRRSTVFALQCSMPAVSDAFNQPNKLVAWKGSVNSYFKTCGHVSLKDSSGLPPPAHLPPGIEKVFSEATTCVAVGCFNAAATMFRLCLDLATREKLTNAIASGSNAPPYKTQRDLGLRLPWLFDNKVLPEDLRELSHSVKEDGNDGAHQGTVEQAEVDDLLDFTITLLERLYTEPKKVRMAKERREARRAT